MAKTSRLRIGIDLGGSKIFVALLDGDSVIESSKRRTRAELGYEAVLSRITKQVQKVCKAAAVSPARLESVGIGVPGPVVGNQLLHAPNLGWKSPKIAADLEHALGVKRVRLGNDVNCGALGEARLGAARGARSAFAIFVGTGLGGGWVHAGRVHEGVSGFAGEVGHLQIPGEAAPCGCGQSGCLETIASKRGLQRLLTEAKERGQACAIENLAELRSRDLEQAFRAGCPSTTQALQVMALHLGWAMNVIACILNPDVIVLGGGIGERLGRELLPMINTVQERAEFIARNGSYQVRVGELGPAAVAIGAANLG